MARNRHLEENKKLLLLTTTVIGIVTSIMQFSNIIPEHVKGSVLFKILTVLILLFIALPTMSSISNYTYKLKINKICTYGFVIGVFTLAILSVLLQDSTSNPSNVLAENKTRFDSVEKEQSASIIGDHNRNLQLQSSDNNHIINGNNNTVGVNGDVTYNVSKPSPRQLNKGDIEKITSSIPSNDIRVRVSYPANDKESSHFGKQIFDRLVQLGYKNITNSVYSNSMNYSGADRISVRIDSLPFHSVSLIVNPQQ